MHRLYSCTCTSTARDRKASSARLPRALTFPCFHCRSRQGYAYMSDFEQILHAQDRPGKLDSSSERAFLAVANKVLSKAWPKRKAKGCEHDGLFVT
eukprot:6203092-Pleurochrysis_carterae.AAC.4